MKNGLKDLQKAYHDKAYHDGIKCSPYKAMFGCEVKFGLKSSHLPSKIIYDVLNEEVLRGNEEQLIKNQEEQEQSVGETQSEEGVVSNFGC